MGLASPRASDAAASVSPPSLSAGRLARDKDWWVEPTGWAALAVFIAVPIFATVYQDYAGGVVWTILVACLPIFIVLVGYHRWRRLCPLAFFAQLPLRLKRPGTRKAGPWLEANYYYVVFGVFFVSLWLRLIATNGDGYAITAFFVVLALTALLFGLLYTGKTWCNYICPVSFVEKIYTEPHGLRETPNSQCEKCTACKKSCPDINQENGYWKDIHSPPKRFVYYAFPGLVFGFYFYFYLQSGTWHYYFSGAWTRQPGLILTAFAPGYDGMTGGFFFARTVPRALAAAVTLALGGLASWCLLSQLERLLGGWLRRKSPPDEVRTRHLTMTIAAFAAFITFYSFAGAPTLRLFPWMQHLFLILVIAAAALFLARRLFRTQQAFAEETLAKNILKHWEWVDVEPPKDLREAFLVHTIRSRESKKGSAQILEIYKNAVRETLAHGYITRPEVQRLESLRNQLHIRKVDHEKIMSELAEEERDLLSDPDRQLSAEKVLQLETYTRVLESYLERVFAADGTPDDSFLMELRAEYHVTPEEHAAVMDKLLGGTSAGATQLVEEIKVIERTSHTIEVLAQEPSPAYRFLSGLLQRRRERAIDRILHRLGVSAEEDAGRAVRGGLSANDRPTRETAVEGLGAHIPQATAAQLLSAYRATAAEDATLSTMVDILRARAVSTDPYVRAVALYLLDELNAIDDVTLTTVQQDEHSVVREVSTAIRERRSAEAAAAARKRPLTTIEKMFALGAAPMFSQLTLEGIAELAQASVDVEYAPGQTLCEQHAHGDEVFIVLAGEVTIVRGHGADEQVINAVGPGDLIGEMAVLDPAPRSATARAGAPGVHVLRLNGDSFREVLNANPTIAFGIISTLAQRLRGTMEVQQAVTAA
jgi:mannose-6-phosphate isomerase-like protein (cupin superfamily)